MNKGCVRAPIDSFFACYRLLSILLSAVNKFSLKLIKTLSSKHWFKLSDKYTQTYYVYSPLATFTGQRRLQFTNNIKSN